MQAFKGLGAAAALLGEVVDADAVGADDSDLDAVDNRGCENGKDDGDDADGDVVHKAARAEEPAQLRAAVMRRRAEAPQS
jgi:hypothetical protein